jgi:hypothetical protein
LHLYGVFERSLLLLWAISLFISTYDNDTLSTPYYPEHLMLSVGKCRPERLSRPSVTLQPTAANHGWSHFTNLST